MELENWEIQSMKDDLYTLGYELEGTRDGDTVNKAWNYINDLEEKLINIAINKEKELSNFADYLIKNASYAFEYQDRELLEKVLRNYRNESVMK